MFMRDRGLSDFILSLSILCFACWRCSAAEPAEREALPNIVIIYADDMGYGDLGIQNPDSKIPTPNLDRLAREGVRFTDAHSSSGICTPSRYALLTGRYHWRKFHGIVNSWGDTVFDSARLTLPEMLKEKGYKTACIGKWHLGFNWEAIRKLDAKPISTGRRKTWPADAFDWSKRIPNGPLDHGFDYYFGDDVPNFPPYTWIENDRVVEPPTVPYIPDPRPVEGSPEGRSGPMVKGWRQDQVMPQLTEKVVEWIGKQKGSDKPFFLYFPWTSPHAPIVPTKEFQGSTKAGGYGDFMHQSDWTAGQVLKALDENGFRENTLVIFTADNGPERYAYDRIRNFEHRSMGPLRGLKRDIWEGGHRVPFVVRWPGMMKPGRVSHALVSQIDIMATIATIVGFELPDTTAEDSHDLLPLWRGEPNSDGIRTAHVHNTKADHYAIRQGDWLLIDAQSGGISPVPDWFDKANGYKPNPHYAALYNLRDDVAERENLIKQHRAKVAELHTLLAQLKKQGHSAPRLSDTVPMARLGIMVGEGTPKSALVQLRLCKTDKLVDQDVPGVSGVVQFNVCEADLPPSVPISTKTVDATTDRDFIARAVLKDLKPNTRYRCDTRIGTSKKNLQDGPTAFFKTLPGLELAEPTRFVVVTGMNYAKFHGDDRIDRKIHLEHNNTELPRPYSGTDKHLGYPGLASILKLKPDFFVGTGDNVYYDTPKKPRAESLAEMRQKWHEQWVQPRYRDLFAAVPTYWMIDDHDYRIDDGDNSGDYDPTPELAQRVMLEQLPYAPADKKDVKTYRTHRISRDLQIWLVENRIYRSPNAMKDGPEKTIWGAEQKAWLKRTLLESDATFKLLISPNPMIGPDDARKTDNHTNLGGFQHERNEFFNWLKKNGFDKKGFGIICGDRHWQYHAVHPLGIEEFSCGALVDANSRLGRKPGDPASTDPKGLIKQLYSQNPRSGGFLIVDVSPAKSDKGKAKLTFAWHDEFGKVLHRHTK